MLSAAIGHEGTQDPDVKKPDGSEDHSQIVSSTAKYSIDGIAEAALEPIATELAFVFHVSDGRFDGAASMNGFPD